MSCCLVMLVSQKRGRGDKRWIVILKTHLNGGHSGLAHWHRPTTKGARFDVRCSPLTGQRAGLINLQASIASPHASSHRVWTTTAISIRRSTSSNRASSYCLCSKSAQKSKITIRCVTCMETLTGQILTTAGCWAFIYWCLRIHKQHKQQLDALEFEL